MTAQKKVSNTILRAKFEHTFALFTFYSWSKGIRFITFRFLATLQEQEKLFEEGKSNCDGIKKVSKHQKGRAKDIGVLDKDGEVVWGHIPEYDILGELWEQLGGTWGGHWYIEGKTKFDDCYHFEM